MSKIKPTIESKFIVHCCKEVREFQERYEALSFLLGHISQNHKQMMSRIEKQGRKLARSQNGRGYYDGSDKDTGWLKAQPTFRQAWREKALERSLRAL